MTFQVAYPFLLGLVMGLALASVAALVLSRRTKSESSGLRQFLYFIPLAFILWAVFGLLPLWIVRWLNLPSQEQNSATGSITANQVGVAGTLGDSFGAANTLFSVLTVAGALYSIRLQSEELKLQRQELEETRGELQRSADAQSKSEQTFALQTRLSVYGTLAEYHRSTSQSAMRTAPKDILLHHRSIGRERGYAELIEKSLHEVPGSIANEWFSKLINRHENRIDNLDSEYRELDFTEDAFDDWAATRLHKVALFLLEEIASLVVLNPGSVNAERLLEGAGNDLNELYDINNRQSPESKNSEVMGTIVRLVHSSFQKTRGAINWIKDPE